MMKRQLLHTPEGVRDIYNEECEKKQVLQEKLKNGEMKTRLLRILSPKEFAVWWVSVKTEQFFQRE